MKKQTENDLRVIEHEIKEPLSEAEQVAATQTILHLSTAVVGLIAALGAQTFRSRVLPYMGRLASTLTTAILEEVEEVIEAQASGRQ